MNLKTFLCLVFISYLHLSTAKQIPSVLQSPTAEQLPIAEKSEKTFWTPELKKIWNKILEWGFTKAHSKEKVEKKSKSLIDLLKPKLNKWDDYSTTTDYWYTSTIPQTTTDYWYTTTTRTTAKPTTTVDWYTSTIPQTTTDYWYTTTTRTTAKPTTTVDWYTSTIPQTTTDYWYTTTTRPTTKPTTTVDWYTSTIPQTTTDYWYTTTTRTTTKPTPDTTTSDWWYTTTYPTTTTTPRPFECPAGWLHTERGCFLFDYSSCILGCSWFEASDICRGHGAHLVEIDTSSKWDLVSSQLYLLSILTHTENLKWWTGGHYNPSSGSFYWFWSGSWFYYTDWATYEPSVYRDASMHLALPHGDTRHRWYSSEAGGRNGHPICEK